MKTKSIAELMDEADGPKRREVVHECLRRLRRLNELLEMGEAYSKRDFFDKVVQAAEGRFGDKKRKFVGTSKKGMK